MLAGWEAHIYEVELVKLCVVQLSTGAVDEVHLEASRTENSLVCRAPGAAAPCSAAWRTWCPAAGGCAWTMTLTRHAPHSKPYVLLMLAHHLLARPSARVNFLWCRSWYRRRGQCTKTLRRSCTAVMLQHSKPPQLDFCIHPAPLLTSAILLRFTPPHLAVVATLSLTRTAQDARLILTAPEPALAECLIPPSAALAYEAHLRSSDAGAAAAPWDLAAAPPRVCARLLGVVGNLIIKYY